MLCFSFYVMVMIKPLSHRHISIINLCSLALSEEPERPKWCPLRNVGDWVALLARSTDLGPYSRRSEFESLPGWLPSGRGSDLTLTVARQMALSVTESMDFFYCRKKWRRKKCP